MPKLQASIKQLDRDAYCSAPLIRITVPPRLTRNAEARRPRAPLQTPEIKAEISSIKLIEDAENLKPRIPFDSRQQSDLRQQSDPRQQTDLLRASIAALAISSSSLDEKPPTVAPGRFRYAGAWGIRGAHLCHMPDGDMGLADPPRRRG